MSSGIARAPRARVTVNGTHFTPLQCSVRVSKHQSADTFFCEVALDEVPGFDEKFWSDAAPLAVAVSGTNDIATETYRDLLTGQIERVQVILQKRTAMLRGQDKTALLIEAKSSEKWLNKSDKDIITELAERAGLSVQFNADTDKSGLEFSDDRNEIASLDSAWNIIVTLAKKAGSIAFVKGDTLYVQPIDADNGDPYTIDYQKLTEGVVARSNAAMITLNRDLNLAKEVSVKVESWRHKAGEAVTSELTSKPKGESQAKKRLYQFRAPNLTKKQQDRIAKGRMKEILAHEREIEIDLPGDVEADPLRPLRLTGTGTSFDQDYILAEVLHRFDLAGGYQMSMRAHNQDAGRGAPETVK